MAIRQNITLSNHYWSKKLEKFLNFHLKFALSTVYKSNPNVAAEIKSIHLGL